MDVLIKDPTKEREMIFLKLLLHHRNAINLEIKYIQKNLLLRKECKAFARRQKQPKE